VIWGSSGFGFASFLFGILDSPWPLDAARFIQGIAGALIWSGALTWIIKRIPDDQRGQVIGTALGTAVAGSLLGPALGALAGTIGTEPGLQRRPRRLPRARLHRLALPRQPWCGRTSRCARCSRAASSTAPLVEAATSSPRPR